MDNKIEQIAEQNGMTVEFVTWFFNEKKSACGEHWFLALGAMWEAWKARDASLNAERVWEKTMMEVCGEDGPASVANEIRALQGRRDTALTALRAQVEQLAAENVGLKAAFDKPQAYLSWHAIPPTWDDPLPCGEYLDVHDTDGHKNSDGTDCWPVYAKPEIETPATDLFIASLSVERAK